MNVVFTEEQEMLRASARDFLEKECTEDIIAEIERSGLGYSPDLWQKIADLGWLGLVFPEEYGGSEMNLIDLAVMYEEFGRAMFPSPYTSTIIFGGMTILDAGNDTQKSGILPEMISGEKIITLAMNESEPGQADTECDPERVTITASADGENFIIHGSKLFVHYANIADVLLIPARTKNSDNPEEGITLFMVDTDNPGIRISRLATFPGDNQCEVIFDNVRVSGENIVGTVHEGWAPLEKSIRTGSVMLASQMLGAGEQLLKLSEEDYQSRLETGIPDDIKSHNEEYIEGLRKDIDTCRWITYQAAQRLVNGEACDFETVIAQGWKSYAHQNA